MSKYILLIALMLTSTFSFSQNYDANLIPEKLTQDAVAVIRNEEQFYDFKSVGSGQYNYKIAITILNKAGDGFAEMGEVYDKFSSIYNIKAALYDANGKKVKEYKSADIKDQSLISDYSMFEDNRIKYLNFLSTTYPYTIEYSYSQDFKGILYFPSWHAIKSYGMATEKSSYIFQRAAGLHVKYITSPNLKTDSAKVNDKMQYKWSTSNSPALVREPMGLGLEDVVAWAKISPTNFEYDNTTGNFDNWKNFGAWINKLNENGTNLPPATRAQIQNLTKEAKTPKEKVRILYQYLQQNTRYVSVQLGIGGFKPILAEKVAQVNYGDCKALSNYMKALLNEVGIKSNLVVIGNGMPSMNANYSSMGQANHMILRVSLPNETTFLECTSQHHPMGFIGHDNSDRNVLMITENGGEIIRTPIYKPQDNYQSRKTTIDFKDDLMAFIHIKSTYANAQFENNLSNLLAEPTEQRKRIIQNNDIPGVELVSFNYKQDDKTLPILTEEISLKTNQLLSKGGDKLFLMLNQVNRREAIPLKIENRKSAFSVGFGYQDEDEINYTLPKGYAVEFLPKDISIQSDFGIYTAKFITKSSGITYQRTLTVNPNQFPPERYNEYVDFLKKILQADKQKAILAKVN